MQALQAAPESGAYETRVEGPLLDTSSPEPRLDIKRMLAEAVSVSGRRPAAIGLDMAKMLYGSQRLNPQEYFYFRMYDPALTAEDRREFVGARGARALNDAFNDLANAPRFMDDKVVHGAMLRGLGLPAPRVQALVGETPVGDLRHVSNVAALVAFLANDAVYPLFGKPRHGSGSCGAMSIDGYDLETGDLLLAGGKRAPAAAFAQEVMEHFAAGYVFQDRVVQHPELSRLCGPAVGTVRLVLLERDGRAQPLYAIWKIPSLGAVADNFWRSGNMVAHLRPESGEIERVQRGIGPDAEPIESHPETGEMLAGQKIPQWEALVETTIRAAAATPEVLMTGWDVAMTADGPMIIEANGSPMHTLYQHATGRGLLTPDLRAAAEAAKAKRVQAARERKVRRRAARKAHLQRVRAGLRAD